MSLFLAASCSSEDTPVADYHDPSAFFMPADTATDAESELRRQFYEETGSYLLFNDTLQYTPTGKDINGNDTYSIEKLDIGYDLQQTGTYTNTYTYQDIATLEQKQAAVEYLKEFILVHLSERLRPFSWYLTSVISGVNNYGNTVRPYAVSGQRCIALRCQELPRLTTDARKQQLATNHLLVIVGAVATNNSSSFADFYNVSGSLYGADTPSADLTNADYYALGFLGKGSSVVAYPSQSEDLNAYASLVISNSESALATRFADYPLVLQKISLMKNTLIELGYTF